MKVHSIYDWRPDTWQYLYYATQFVNKWVFITFLLAHYTVLRFSDDHQYAVSKLFLIKAAHAYGK